MRVRDMQQRPWLWPPASACPNRERLLDRPHAGDWERTGAPLQVPIREAGGDPQALWCQLAMVKAESAVLGWQGVRDELTYAPWGRLLVGLKGRAAGRSQSGSRPRTCRRCGGGWPRARRRSTRSGATRRWPAAAARRAAMRPRRAATARPRVACKSFGVWCHARERMGLESVYSCHSMPKSPRYVRADKGVHLQICSGSQRQLCKVCPSVQASDLQNLAGTCPGKPGACCILTAQHAIEPLVSVRAPAVQM